MSRQYSEEYRKKCSVRMQKMWTDDSYRDRGLEHLKALHDLQIGKASGMKGKTQTEASREKISKAQIGKTVSEETRRKISATLNGQPFTDERRKNISDSLMGKKQSDEQIQKSAASRRGMKRSPEARKKMSEVAMGRIRSTETRTRMSVAKKKMFQDDMAYVSMMAKSWRLKPNKPETFLTGLLDELYPSEWKYTGDFSFMINGKSPDFVNCNGQKKIIELFGNYWHKGQDPQDRIDTFTPFGFDTLVIWEHELKDIETVKSKITAFNLRKGTPECAV